MRNEVTLEKLNQLRLSGMAACYEEQSQSKDYQNLSFEEHFKLLVDFEYARRQSNKLERLIKQVGFEEPSACIEDIEYYPDRHIDKELMTRLSTGQYILDITLLY